VFTGLHEHDLDLRNQDHDDSLLNCMLSTRKKMDKRHLEVFARATNSRIVLLSYHLDTDCFTGIDMDWQNIPPKIGTFIEIPNFGKDYDFYRTAIVTYSRTRDPAKCVDENDIKFSNSNWHFSLWIPEGYEKRIHEKKNLPSDNGNEDNADGPMENQPEDETFQGKMATKVQEETVHWNVQNVKYFSDDSSTDDEGGNDDEDEGNDDETYQLPNNLFEDIVLEVPECTDSIPEKESGPNGGISNYDLHDMHEEEDMDGKEAEPTGRKKSGNSNEHVEGKPLIASTWYKDTKDERYKGSTEWLLVNWLTSEDNFSYWTKPGEEKKEEIQKRLAKMINQDGIDNHNGLIRNRRTKRIGEHINRMFRGMKIMYAKVQHALNEGYTIEDVQRISKTCKYYDLLLPTMEKYLVEHWRKKHANPKTQQETAIVPTQQTTTQPKHMNVQESEYDGNKVAKRF
jgi:hypothetical protein